MPKKTKRASSAGAPRRRTVFANVRVVLPGRVTPACHLVIDDGRIASMTADLPKEPGATVVDAAGRYAMPGFIDVHCHGEETRDFFREVNEVAAAHLRKGTTGVLATLGYDTMRPGGLHLQVKELWEARDEIARKTVLGVHLEGPYTNSKYGALVVPGSLHRPDPAEYGPVLEQWSEVVRLWTLAPELEPSGAFVDAASAKGIILAAGHTEAGADLLRTLVSRGLRVATHWSNATGVPPPRFRGTRSPGTDEFALLCDDIVAEVIPDSGGCHVTPIMQQLLYRVKGPDRIMLISDAFWSSAAGDARGCEAGDPGLDVFLTREGDLCGSKLCMADAARNFRKHTGCGLPEISRMGALNQAKLFGWSDDLGSLEVGKVANLILTDDALAIHGVWLAGQPVS